MTMPRERRTDDRPDGAILVCAGVAALFAVLLLSRGQRFPADTSLLSMSWTWSEVR